ncbi:MAG: hypothetical protein QW674_07880 [Candidatus Bathyarchaeia archaeon]
MMKEKCEVMMKFYKLLIYDFEFLLPILDSLIMELAWGFPGPRYCESFCWALALFLEWSANKYGLVYFFWDTRIGLVCSKKLWQRYFSKNYDVSHNSVELREEKLLV